MKTLLYVVKGLCSVVLAAAITQASQAELLVHYTFDEAASGATNALNGGSASSADGVFQGGATRTTSTPGGYSTAALDLYSGGHNDDFVKTSADVDAVDGLTSMTVTAWINLRAAPSDFGDRILEDMDNSSGSLPGWAFLFDVESGEESASALRLKFSRGGSSGYGNVVSDVSFDADKKWAFVAVTWDSAGDSNNLKFYHGDENTAPSQLGSAQTLSGAPTDNSTALYVGQRDESDAAYDRIPPIWIDDVRVYSGVVDDLDAIRQANIPEPSTLTLLACGLIGLLCYAWRKRK